MSLETDAKSNNKPLKYLLGDTDPKLDAEMREKLITARVGLLLNNQFFGNLATRLKLVNADKWCTTAATDGRHFYYNSRFIEMLSQKEVEFLFGHEVLHVAYDHFGRKGERDHQLWNVACDYAVNGDLKWHKVGQFITTVPALYDPKYKDIASEEIYDELYENAEKINIDDLIDKLLDEHIDADDANEEGAGPGEEGHDTSKPIPLTKEQKEQIKDEMKEALINAASTSEAGKVPAGIQRIIKDLTEPQMDFRELLQMNIQSLIKNDFTFAKVSRKGWHFDAVLPGMNNDEAIDIAIGLDLSGSITNEMGRDMISEIYGITQQFGTFKIHLFTFDTEVYNYQVFDSDSGQDISEYELKGGGGTSYECIFNFLKEEGIEPQKLVVFTDGYPWNTWGDPNYCETLWIIHSNPNPEPEFGDWVPYQLAA
jgi:predicted metal-dependent peptidase